MYIFKQVFRIRMIFIFLSSELYIKEKHSNGMKFSHGDCYIIWCHKNTLYLNYKFYQVTASLLSPIDFHRMLEII